MVSTDSFNPLLSLDYEAALESLGDDYYDVVPAAAFPKHSLRFRNDDLLPTLALDPLTITDQHFVEAFGRFRGREPFLALRYHGYQFGDYNPFLGDGRGFLYGQVRGLDGELYDFGTKGSGTTPYSRGGDGRLTLKGGVREVLAGEALHRLGVKTSRCLSLIETGEALWRGDEPSPTRASVMVRFSRSHIRFGVFERFYDLQRPDLSQRLLDHVIAYYYPTLHALSDPQERYAQFYAELVQRVADLVAQWMSVGFCHAVLNTDNMSITGESFDYGPYAFIDQYNPRFTAAYFDYFGRYSYGAQPQICRWNLEMLQLPLKAMIPLSDMEAGLSQYEDHYQTAYRQRMLSKLGFDDLSIDLAKPLVKLTIRLLEETVVSYHDFFLQLSQQFSRDWRSHPDQIFGIPLMASDPGAADLLDQWRHFYHHCLKSLPEEAMERIAQRLRQTNPATVLLKPEIEAIWEPIMVEDNWVPFHTLLKRLRQPFPLGS